MNVERLDTNFSLYNSPLAIGCILQIDFFTGGKNFIAMPFYTTYVNKFF